MSEIRQQTEFEIRPITPPDVFDSEQKNDLLVVRRFSHFSELYSIAAEWDELVSESETNTVHQLFAWNEIWWRHLANKRDLFVLSVRWGDHLVGIAPLM